MKRLRHIFWDWNGTLLDDAWLCLDVMNRMLAARDLPRMSPERYREIFDFPISRYYDQLAFDYDLESFEVLGREFIDGYELRRGEAGLFSDVRSSLERVRELGWHQSVLSAYQHDTLVTLVADHGLTEFFQDLHGHHNIYPEGKTPQGRQALEDLGLDPDEAVLIGDTVHDAEVAAELGMGCILVPGGNQPEERLRATGIEVVPTRKAALDWLMERI